SQSPQHSAVARRAPELLGQDAAMLEDVDGATVFFDAFVPPPELIVVGAGEDAPPLAHAALAVGFRVSVVDRRPGRLDRVRFPHDATLIASDAAALAGRAVLGASSYV